MDIAAFISELLTQNGVLIVPELGTFTKVRVDGYYNKEEQQFYPPTHQIQFKREYDNDAVLANLIARQRQISVASAKYFIEKYISNVLEQAGTGNAPFGTMGVFSTRRGTLFFSPSELNETDEQLYGLAPVKLKRNNAFKQPTIVIPPPVIEPVVLPEPAIEIPPPVIEPPVVTEQVVEQQPDEEEDEDAGGTKVNAWLVVALIIVLIGISIIGAYLYKPSLFKPLLSKFSNTAPDTVKATDDDSVKLALQAQKDTTAANATNVTAVDTFSVEVGQLKTFPKAQIEADRYAKKGFNATVHQSPDGTHYDVNIGIYTSYDSAKANLIIMQKKLNNQNISIHTYPFKKQ